MRCIIPAGIQQTEASSNLASWDPQSSKLKIPQQGTGERNQSVEAENQRSNQSVEAENQ